MNTNTLKLPLVAILVHAMCVTVVLSHMHAKDAVSLMSQQANLSRITSTTDVVAKAMGDLHHHVDKAGLKNATADHSTTTAARNRKLNPLDAEVSADDSLLNRFLDFLLRFRVVSTLIYSYV